ncbi:MAG TPA: hypothetical protein VKA06_08990, partial [Spirochaetia bacterium]|nr:hypothetical protein [Spirochaetia bacterium]
ISVTSFEDPRPDGVGTIDLTLTDPTVEYFWQANVVDLQAQASKKILLFTPFVGAGASIGFGSAGGGLRSELVTSPTQLTDADYAEINAALAEQGGETLPALGENGFSVTSDMPAGWAFRAYGGVGINLLIVKIDITGMYDFIGQNYGLTVGARVQL